eukprot:jgi/Mesvir1/2404/Mv22146-RA.1
MTAAKQQGEICGAGSGRMKIRGHLRSPKGPLARKRHPYHFPLLPMLKANQEIRAQTSSTMVSVLQSEYYCPYYSRYYGVGPGEHWEDPPTVARACLSPRATPAYYQSQVSYQLRPHRISTAVISACVGNSIILLAKLIVYAQSNSSVMLAEAMHSLADLSNQCLLLVGLVRSRRAPDAKHPYGYSRERFVWALISAVGIFFCGSGMSVAHGVYGFLHPEAVESMGSLAAVLLVSTVIETATLAIALRAVRLNAAAAGLSAWQYVRSAQDPLAVAVLAEDGAAVLGLGIAGVCLSLMHVTGQAFWDPLGSILIGQLLGAVAVFLISQNRRALVGQSMSMQDMMRVMSLLQEDPVVRALHDCKSEVIGPGAYRFKAEIDFCGKAVVTNFLQRKGQAHIFSPVQAACDARDEGMLEAALKLYGEELVLSMGEEVDRLERKIQELMPEIRHVDIETHARGSRG